MKQLYTILFAVVLSFNVNASPSTAVAAPLVLDSEATDFETESEYGDAQGMAYWNGMRSGRDFYLGDYLGFDVQWFHTNNRGFFYHYRGFSGSE